GGASSGELGGPEVGLPYPAVDGDLPVAHVDRYDELLVELADRGREEPWLDGRRADDHPRGSCGEPAVDRLERAVAAAHLHRHTAGRRDHPLHEVDRGSAAECAVEIDEMEELRALGGEPGCGSSRVTALHGDGFADTFSQ